MSTRIEQIHEALRRITGPISEQLSVINAEIREHEAALKDLREARAEVVAILRRIDPTLTPTARPKAQSKGVAEEKVTAVQSFLLQYAADLNGNGGFCVTDLMNHEAFTVQNPGSVSKALSVLHERSILQLDHTGRGGSRYFKVVTR